MWRHFECSLKKGTWVTTGGYTQLDLVRLFLLLEVLQSSPTFSRTDTFFFPLLFRPTKHSPHSGKPPAVTHFPFFQTAPEMMSRRCIVAWPVFTKNCMLLTQKKKQTKVKWKKNSHKERTHWNFLHFFISIFVSILKNIFISVLLRTIQPPYFWHLFKPIIIPYGYNYSSFLVVNKYQFCKVWNVFKLVRIGMMLVLFTCLSS